jgi:predicted HicB family RNase H-like nuclease
MEYKYKGYIAEVEFDEDAQIFHGEVINIRDVITFQGVSILELQQAFQDSVEDYLEFCASRGEEPEKPFLGKLVPIKPQNRIYLAILKEKRILINSKWDDILVKNKNISMKTKTKNTQYLKSNHFNPV